MSGGNVYAEALFSLSEELGQSDGVLADVKIARKAFKDNKEYVKLLDTPALAPSEKTTLIDKAFAPLTENVRNLIKILCEKHSVYLFDEIAKIYSELYDESRGIVTAEVLSATPLTDAQKDKLRIKLEKETGKTIIINNTIDKDLLGGIKLRYMGKELDGSLRARLTSIEKSLKGAVL